MQESGRSGRKTLTQERSGFTNGGCTAAHSHSGVLIAEKRACPSAGRKLLKRRIMNLLDLPPEMDDPYWDEWEFFYLRSSRTRRALFEDRFNLAMYEIRKEEGKA